MRRVTLYLLLSIGFLCCTDRSIDSSSVPFEGKIAFVWNVHDGSVRKLTVSGGSSWIGCWFNDSKQLIYYGSWKR